MYKRNQEDEGIISKFNPGMLQMQRLHNLQDQLNLARMNPTVFNPDFGVYNYQLIFKSLNSLLMECWGKLKSSEQRTGRQYREWIKKRMIMYPVHSQVRNSRNMKTTINFDEIAWKYIENLLTKYESVIRVYLDEHGLASPAKGEEGLFG